MINFFSGVYEDNKSTMTNRNFIEIDSWELIKYDIIKSGHKKMRILGYQFSDKRDS